MSDKKKTILVIDDNLSILTTIQSILEKNYELSLAKNADIAKTILNAAKIDLILLDVEMPGISGIEFLEILNKSPEFYHIPVIIVSSLGKHEIILNAKKNGAVDFVIKPISPEILTEKINSALLNARIKINNIRLFTKLKFLENVVKKGHKSKVEEIIDELEHYYYELKTDPEIAEICKFARTMEYKTATEKINTLMKKLS